MKRRPRGSAAGKGSDLSTVTLGSLDDGRILRLTLDTGARGNVITPPALDDLHAAIDEAEARKPRALILEGAGGSFSRGADLDSIKAMGAAFRGYIESEFRLFDRVDRLPFATIAVLRGHVIGNAAELALACDFRVAAASSTFCLPEIAVGFVAPAQRLARLLGIARAKELLLRARRLSAAEAHALALVTEVAEDAAADAAALAIAEEFAGRAPLAIRATKEGIAHAFGHGPSDWIGEEAWAWRTYDSADGREAMAALAERRAPVFRGI